MVERCTDRLREEDEGHVHANAGIVPGEITEEVVVHVHVDEPIEIGGCGGVVNKGRFGVRGGGISVVDFDVICCVRREEIRVPSHWRKLDLLPRKMRVVTRVTVPA